MRTNAILGMILSLILVSNVALAGDGKRKKNKDGAAKGNRWEKKFDKIDTNDDGQISKEEFKAFREQRREAKAK